jgi:hypothetical protein
MTDVKPPQAFYDFTSLRHQDLDGYPGWASAAPNAGWELFEDFRQGFADRAVKELAVYFRRLLNDKNADLKPIWLRKPKADWLVGNEGFADFSRTLAFVLHA